MYIKSVYNSHIKLYKTVYIRDSVSSVFCNSSGSFLRGRESITLMTTQKRV